MNVMNDKTGTENLVRDFLELIVNKSGLIIRPELEQTAYTIILRRITGVEDIDFGFSNSSEYADSLQYFLEDNGVTFTDELTNHFQSWKNLPSDAFGRFGIDASRSLNGEGIVWCGGIIGDFDQNFFIGDYDFAAHDIDPREATTGGIKMGFSLAENRFVTIKTYTRFGWNFEDSDATQNFVFSINPDNTLVKLHEQGCIHFRQPTEQSEMTPRWQDKWDDLQTIKSNHSEPWINYYMKCAERANDDQDQGYLYFSRHIRRFWPNDV
jgi:hypothetical protein